MSLYKPPNSNFWWSDLRHNGKRLRETTYHVDKAQRQFSRCYGRICGLRA